MAHLFWPDAERLTSQGFASIAHVPVIFASNWQYHAEACQYLRERALVEWAPSVDAQYRVARKRYPTEKSLQTIANALINFIEWYERRGLKWQSLTYTKHLVQGYQTEMLKGTWSVSGEGLKARTINQRVSHACNFLLWAAERGLRDDFEIVGAAVNIRADSGTSVHGNRSIQVHARAGAVRQSPASLRIPTDPEVSKWLASVRVERGDTKALMCELVLASAMRREEVIQWRVDTLPLSRSDWQVFGSQVEVVIKYGTKGSKHPGPDGLEGPPRKIAIPLSVAEKLHQYREFRRPKARAQYIRSATSPEERKSRQRQTVKQLFLSDVTGEPISAQVLYEAWTAVSALPYKGWSPHMGRDYWACKKMLEAMERRTRMLGHNLSQVPSGWISDSAVDTLNLIIRPQLGHLSVETTQLYIVWVERAFTLTGVSDQYELSLEALLTTREE